jgi:hypothetical protein
MATLALSSCLQVPNTPVKYALAAIVVTALIVSLTKFDAFYEPNFGKLKDFGTAPGETIFPAWLAMFSAGYIVYTLASAAAAFNSCH